MPYLYLIVSIFLSSSSNVLGKLFSRKNAQKKSAGVIYTFTLLLSVSLGWGIRFALDRTFDPTVLWYSLLFAIFYATVQFGVINALQHGPAVLTSLFTSLSMILTTIWGFFFWDSPLTLTVGIGLCLVVVSIVLCLYTKGSKDKAISGKWLLFVAMAFFGNAGCSIVQRTQQVNYDGQYGNMLMFFAMVLSVLAYLVIFLKSDKRDTKAVLKTSWWMPAASGLCNLFLNVLVMLMAVSTLSPSLIYPVIGLGGLSIVTIFSQVVFKEKMSPAQWCGIATGAVAVLLLSI